MIPVGTLDSLAITACLAMAFCWWRYFQRPTLARLILAAAMIGLAMSVKFNAAAIALAIGVYALLWWGRDWRVTWREWAGRAGAVAISACVVLMTLWTLTLFDVGVPAEARTKDGRVVLPIERHLPGANYLAAFAAGYEHNQHGHPSYYMGKVGMQGTWSYFPVLSTYKLPVGVAIILLASVLSLSWRKGRWDELSCVVPLCLGACFMLTVNINSGFRHALPVYVFAMVLAGRSLAAADRPMRRAGGDSWGSDSRFGRHVRACAELSPGLSGVHELSTSGRLP